MSYFCGYYKPSKQFCIDTLAENRNLCCYLMEKYYSEDWFMDESFSVEEVNLSIIDKEK